MKKLTLYLSIVSFIPFLLTGCVSTERFYPSSPTFVKAFKTPFSKQHNGNPITCSIIGGQANFSSGWFPINNTEFKIYKGDAILVPVKKKSKQETADLRIRFDKQGQKMVFCPEKHNTQVGQRISCSSLYALDDDYEMGIKRTFDVPKMVRGSTMLCKYSHDTTT